MRKVLLLLTVLALLSGPVLITVVGVVVVASATGSSGCGPTVTTVPAALTATTADSAIVHLDRVQLTHAATIINTGGQIQGVGHDGILVALMAALTESRMRMLANTGAYPTSANYPNDGDASDHDSLGLFQMRPAAGWGTVEQLMDPRYQARAFFGGADGPNTGSPRGLLDIPNWQNLPKGAAAQAVEVSAFPDRYAAYEPVARTILTNLTQNTPDAPTPDAEKALSAGLVVFPLPDGVGTRLSGFGYRIHPIFGVGRLHAGTDYAAPPGTPVLAVASGVVSFAGPYPGAGNMIVLDHRINGQVISTAYFHLLDDSFAVADGDPVQAGQQIAGVGSTGDSTGPHLHLEVHPGGFTKPAIDPEPWLTRQAAKSLTEAAVGSHPTCRFLNDLSE
ncbi:M23 family metallopeptidase [Promicromonospora sp. NPDC023987]|uniref:M23 family metallopeptidase n=1 Tax=Promicromonospora sp. NPDC023987 TaxID=3155360 RepID=UPI0033F15865